MHRHSTADNPNSTFVTRHSSLGTLYSALCIAIAALSASADGPNLIANGDFEAAGYTGNYIQNCGSAYLIGWDCSQAGICTPQGTFLSTAIKNYDNSAWAFLKAASWFSQEIAVEAGPYRLEYDFCGRPSHIASADVTITLGDLVITNFTGAGGCANGTAVAHHVINFRVPESGTFALKFAQATTADMSPAFDNITLVQTIRQSLTIAASPKEIGSVTPAYGFVSTNANATYSCSAPATVATEYASWTLSGWNYYENDALVNSGTTTSTNIVIQADVLSRLEWLWEPAAGAPVTVSANGAGQYGSIAEALAAFGEGDTEIVLLPGSYPVTETIVLDKPMTFRSSTGDWRDVTVYRTGSTQFPVFRIAHAGVVLSGITITNGFSTTSNQGGGVTTTAAATIRDCRIAKNTGICSTVNLVDGAKLLRCRVDENFHSASGHHVGVYMVGSALAEDCEVINNDSSSRNYNSDASAFRIDGGTIRRCVVTNNFNSLGSYGHAGAIKTGGNCLIENCLVAGNTGSYGGNFPKGTSGVAAGIYVSKAGCVVRNCTIADNMGTGRGGIRTDSDGNLRLENSIVWGNVDIGNVHNTAGANASTPLSDSNISYLSPRYATNVCSTIFFGEGSIAGDPLFVDALHGDYRLAANSPCRNAGYTRPGDDTATDLAGNPRVAGGAIDIGCFEGTAAEPSVTLPDIRQDVYLTAGGDIAEALSHCSSGSTLHLGPGDYPVSRTLVVTGGVHIVSDAGPAATSIYRDGPYGAGARFRILVADSADFLVSGITFSNSYVEVGVAAALAMNGGTASNCVFTANYTIPHSYAGGIVFAKGGRVVDCVFHDNYGSGGMGGVAALHAGAVMERCDLIRNRNPNANNGSSQVFAHDNAVIRRCRFIGNVASGGGIGGALNVVDTGVLLENCLFACNSNLWASGNCTGGISFGANGARIVNCTIVGNYGKNGGIWASAKSAVVVNTLFADNVGTTADASSQGIAGRDNVLFTNCLFAVQSTISGNSYVNCRAGGAAFVDAAAFDYTPTSSSTAVDNGAATPWSEEPPLDLAGNARVKNVVDIGCYEFYPDASLAAAYSVSGNDVAGSDVTFSAIVTGDDLEGLECRWRLVDAAGSGSWTPWLASTDYVPSSPAPGRYTLELEVRNGAGEEAASDMEGAVFTIAATEVFVAPRTLEGHVAAEPYATRATAATNLADVVDFCGTGTKVTLLDGEHAAPDPASFSVAVDVRSESGDPARCSIHKPGNFESGTQYRLVSLLAGGTFSGLTVSNAYNIDATKLASGLYVYQAAVSNCVFHRCSGTAAFSDGSAFRKCLFTENRGHSENGVCLMQRGAAALAEDCVFTRSLPGTYHLNSTVRVAGGRLVRCAITDNDLAGTATAGTLSNGGTYITDGCVFDNCLIARNRARSSTGAFAVNIADSTKPCVFVNCTVAGNTVVNSSVTTAPLAGYSRVYATNCVFYANTRDDGATATPAFSQAGGTRLVLVNCLAEDTANTTSAADCFAADPKFSDFAGGDFRLKVKSPCVGKGAAYDFTGATDLLGNPRLFGPGVDLGCYELQQGLGSVLMVR